MAILILIGSFSRVEPFNIVALEAEHRSLLPPSPVSRSNGWTPPVLDSDAQLFSWRVRVCARNVSQLGATLTLTTSSRAPVVCRPASSTDTRLYCGSAALWTTGPARYTVTLDVELRSGDGSSATSSVVGTFLRGLERKPGVAGWGGAEWIGLANPNSTANSFRATANLRGLGFARSSDVAEATLYTSGLGGYRATFNERPLDPTSVRGSVTEWNNRTLYFADDVTSDVQRAVAVSSVDAGTVAIGVELYKHWYGLQNKFYPLAYGPRSLKAVLIVTHVNGTTSFVLPTCSLSAGKKCAWRHGNVSSTTYEDLHTGQSGDGRLAVPGWESPHFDRSLLSLWRVPAAVVGPRGELRPRLMPRSRVLEIARPISVGLVTGDPFSPPGKTYRFTLPHEVAGFCTLVLPRGAPAGMTATLRHGEAVDMKSGRLVDVECTGALNPNHGLHCVHMAYVARGNASAMSAHERSWRELALHGNIITQFPRENAHADSGADDELEAFTPAFQFSAFRFVEVSYVGLSKQTAPPDAASLACYRIGTGFDWSGDVVVAASPQSAETAGNAPTAAHRFNTVVSAGRSTAVSNYLFDVPTDCPHREKRGWTGDSLAAHRTLSSFFDMRATYTKWVEDMLFTQSMLGGQALPTIVPCVYQKGACSFDPRTPQGSGNIPLSDIAWGSILNIVGAYTAMLTNDARLGGRVAGGAANYAALLHSYANNESSAFPGLLNATSVDHVGWPGTRLGDWVPAAAGGVRVSTLLNSHHMILDYDAAASMLRWTGNSTNQDASAARSVSPPPETPSAAELEHWAVVARESFAKAFLHNITVPGTGPSPPGPSPPGPSPPGPPHAGKCGSALERHPIDLSCGAGKITSVVFAGYGTVNESAATCPFAPNSTCYVDVSSEVAAACVGRSSCSVECAPFAGQKRICAGVNVNDPCHKVQKHLSVAVSCSSSPPVREKKGESIVGLAFRDVEVPEEKRPQAQTEAAAGMAAMELAPESVIDSTQRIALGKMLVALVLNTSATGPNFPFTTDGGPTITGGVIDMAHLAPELLNLGHPDAAFSLLAADGYPSYYHMAKYGGTLFENWGNAIGCDDPSIGCPSGTFTSGKGVGSLNHSASRSVLVSVLRARGRCWLTTRTPTHTFFLFSCSLCLSSHVRRLRLHRCVWDRWDSAVFCKCAASGGNQRRSPRPSRTRPVDCRSAPWRCSVAFGRRHSLRCVGGIFPAAGALARLGECHDSRYLEWSD